MDLGMVQNDLHKLSVFEGLLWLTCPIHSPDVWKLIPRPSLNLPLRHLLCLYLIIIPHNTLIAKLKMITILEELKMIMK